MTDFSRSAVDTALARRLESALEKMDAEPATAKSFPLQIAKSMIRNVVLALQGNRQPAPVRKLHLLGARFDLVQSSDRPPEEAIESAYLNRTPEPDPACLAQQPEGDDAA